MENTPFPDACLKLIDDCQRRGVRTMIVGLAAVALQGGVMASGHVDLWVESLGNPDFQSAVQAAGGIYLAPVDLRPPTISGPGLDFLDLVSHMSGLGAFAEEYRYVRWIPLADFKIPVLAIERIIVSKRAADRPKDRAMLPILEDLARTIKAQDGNPQLQS